MLKYTNGSARAENLTAKPGADESSVSEALALRAAALKQGDTSEAERILDHLLKQGIEIQDADGFTRWRRFAEGQGDGS